VEILEYLTAIWCILWHLVFLWLLVYFVAFGIFCGFWCILWHLVYFSFLWLFVPNQEWDTISIRTYIPTYIHNRNDDGCEEVTLGMYFSCKK
jgi:hypothetical protein